MNQYLQKFVEENFGATIGSALDLGAGTMVDVNGLNKFGWKTEGVDIKTGTDLENYFISNKAPFNLVYSCYVWHKLKNKEALVKTAYDNLQSGGKVFFHTFDKSDSNASSILDEDMANKFFSEEEFTDIKTSTFKFFDNDEGHKHWHVILQVTATK